MSAPAFGGQIIPAHHPPQNAAPIPVSGAVNGVTQFGGVVDNAATLPAAPQFGGASVNGATQFGGTTVNGVPQFGGTDNRDADIDEALKHLPTARVFPMPPIDGRFNPSFGRWGHYDLPDINGGLGRDYFPRVTTIGKALEDTEFLDKWKTERLLEGITQHREILDFIDVEGIREGTREARDLLHKLSERAREAVGASDAARFGDAVHAWSEFVDLGQGAVEDVPLELRAHVAAYIAACRSAGIRPIAAYVERIVYNPYTGAAGRVDRIGQLPNGTLVILDVKTTKNLDAGLLGISVQLAQYATATHMLSQDGSCWEAMPAGINQNYAIVAHVPSNVTGDNAYCDLVEVDLTLGIENMKRAALVRESRMEKKYLSKGSKLRSSASDYQAWMSAPPPLLPIPTAAPPSARQPHPDVAAATAEQEVTAEAPEVTSSQYTDVDMLVARQIGATTSLDELTNVYEMYEKARSSNPDLGPWKDEYTEWGETHAIAKRLR